MDDFLKDLYEAHRPIKSLGDKYRPRKKFSHCREVLVATFKAEGDGQYVELFESRAPAQFYTIKACAGPNSVGELQPGFTLATGSGEEMGELAAKIAQAVASGMLGLKREDT